MQQSIWFQTLDLDQQRVLNESQPLPDSADVVIVGAGMIGLATAYYLARAGRKNICILDRGTVLGEASGANAGGLWFGQQSAELGPLSPLAVTSSRLYDALAQEFSFDMERPGMLELLEGDDAASESERRAGLVRAAGFRAESMSGKSARALEPGLGVTPAAAIYYADEGHLHPAKLAAALLKHLKSQGVRVCLGVAVKELQPKVVTDRRVHSIGFRCCRHWSMDAAGHQSARLAAADPADSRHAACPGAASEDAAPHPHDQHFLLLAACVGVCRRGWVAG